MKRIALSQGKFALVDDEDYELVNKIKWYYASTGYAAHKDKFIIYLHRLIMNCPKGMKIDHINRNKLDNRRENLRIVDNKQNIWNQRGHYDGSSIYKGVSWVKERKKWVSNITVGKKRKVLGYFNSERHAAMVRDMWAKDLHGKYAVLNFATVTT